jgi:preprotein translocase subunit SecY
MSWRKGATLVGAIALIEIGVRVGLPGVDGVALFHYLNEAGRGGLLGLYAFIAGGGPFRAGVMALGIMPYLTARVFMRLARIVSPRIAALDDDGRITHTRWLTGALALIQSIGFATFLQRTPNVVANPGMGFMTTTVLTLTGASLIAMWFGEKLTEAGESDEPEVPTLSELPERLEASPALIEPALPVSPPLRPHPSTGAETLRKPR